MESPGAHGHSRFSIRPRLHGKTVKDKPLDTVTQSPVSFRLQTGRRVLPSFARVRRERLCPQNGLAINMCSRCHLIGITASLTCPPELGHRLIRPACIRQIVRWRTISLNGQPYPVGFCQLFHTSRIVLIEKLRNRKAHVPQESFRDFQTLHNAPGHYRQIILQVVAAQALEVFPEGRTPILRPRLPTVDMR